MASNKKILIVDDEAHIRNVIALKLKKRGYQVLVAENGEEGLEMIKAHRPDVLISDLLMPKMDGRSLCRHSMAFKKERAFLTILMTCSITPDDLQWLEGMPDTLFMEKPFSPSKLLQHIDHYLGEQ